MTTFDSTVRHTLRFTLCAFLLLSATVASASSQYCSNAPVIGLDETLRGEGLEAGEPDCFRLQPPATGLLMLDLTVAGTATAEPQLGLFGPRAARVKVIEQSPSHMLVASDAQELMVCAGAQDPRAALGEYQLRTAFLELDPRAMWKGEPIEVDPDPRAACLKGEPIEVDPDPRAGSNPLAELCSAQDLDDHADRLLCATAIELGRSTDGMIDNGWGDDRDVFVFELDRTRTVQLETAGEVDTFGGLYDRRGQRLAATGDGGDGANFRLVKTLSPGLYFVRVEAEAWSQGAYDLTVGALERSW